MVGQRLYHCFPTPYGLTPRTLALLAGVALLGGFWPAAQAGDVAVEHAEFIQQGPSWTVRVTLRHADTGWNHYADAWHLVDARGHELAKRVLWHPHVEEQPFTRAQSGVRLPAGLKVLYVEGHDKGHGWSPQRLRVELDRARGVGYTITRDTP